MNFKIKMLKLGIKSRMELFRVYDWQGDTFDQFWTFLDLYYFWLFGKVIPLTNFETFSRFNYFITTWQKLARWYLWQILNPFWTSITFDYLARWYLWPIWTFFWTYVTFDYLVEVLKDIWLVLKLFSDFT